MGRLICLDLSKKNFAFVFSFVCLELLHNDNPHVAVLKQTTKHVVLISTNLPEAISVCVLSDAPAEKGFTDGKIKLFPCYRFLTSLIPQ